MFKSTIALIAMLLAGAAQAERLKDLASIQGVRTNQLIGYGLVVGLNGTGDQTTQTPFTVQTFNNMMAQFGIKVPLGGNVQLKNVAAVSIHADLPAFAKPGQTIDITIASIGNAKSLRGGSLLMTPLKGIDGNVYAIAQGNLVVGGFDAQGGDGSRITVVVNIRPLKNQRGEVTGAINCFYDITERKEAEERQQLLMNELAHRGKNLLAVVHSIASRTMSGKRSLAEASEVFANRIQALARSQTVLMADGFEYASLTEIIRLEIEGFSDRVNADGPNVMLNPKTAQTFALLVHEIATNATKYGALSRPAGRVSIQWKVERTGEEAEF